MRTASGSVAMLITEFSAVLLFQILGTIIFHMVGKTYVGNSFTVLVHYAEG